jgi:hypothetical protein
MVGVMDGVDILDAVRLFDGGLVVWSIVVALPSVGSLCYIVDLLL